MIRAARSPAYLAALAMALVAGCASYRPLPLPAAPDLAQTPNLTIPRAQLDVPGLAPHAVPSDGLDEVTVMTLGVLNNPELKAERLQRGVADAQVLQAGLLPDPELGASFAESALNYGGALNLTEDIRTILTRGAIEAEAKASARQIDLNILWQEIQVAEQARELFIRERSNARLRQILGDSRTLFQQKYQRDRRAMHEGNATAGTVAADITLVANANQAWRGLETQENLDRHKLNALLGLDPQAPLHLIGSTKMKPLTNAEFRQAISSLPRRRIDLRALAAGYQSKQEALRGAILAQFPALSAGVDVDRDPVEGVNTLGPEVTLTLPVFNRNRGQIAMARASRAMLRQQYQAQLDAAVGQADEVWRASHILAAQLKDLDAQIPILRRTAAAARKSLELYNLDAGLYVTTQSNLLAKEAEAIGLQESLETSRSALATLLGLPFSSP